VAKSKEVVQTAANDPERQTALVPMQPQQPNTWTACRNLQDAIQIAQIIAGGSGNPAIPGVTNVATALTKILCGAEYGIGPFAALTGIHCIKGKYGPGALILASVIRRSGRYDYKIVENTDLRCEIEFLRLWPVQEVMGRVSLTAEEVKEKRICYETGTTLKYAWQCGFGLMMFYRCVTTGFKIYMPDLCGGAPIPDDDDEPEPRRIEATIVQPEQITQTSEPPEEETAHVDENGEVILPNARPSPTGEQFMRFDNLCLALKTKPTTLEKKYAELGVRAFVDLSPSQADTLIGQMQAALARQTASETAKKAGQRKSEEATVPA
jgi:hypothetical protein